MPAPKNPSFDEFTFACPCGKKLKATLDQVGKKGTCPQCKSGFVIPDAPDLLTKKLRCTCGLEMAYNILDAGKMSQCPECQTVFQLPGAAKHSMGDLVSKELHGKQRASSNLPTPPESRSNESQYTDRASTASNQYRPIPKASYESWGFGRFFLGIGLFFALFVAIGVLLIYFGRDLDFDKLSPLGSNEKASEPDSSEPKPKSQTDSFPIR